eukprot:TRINITY_DN787_c0_g1_i4.p1 TRINITY_DN787_c0_g1~~TRINITY_DN787_c0_g1_i4.p1  ORF type:complete len:691 (-),score=214.00 TRINITY_DN787_c0_g1_i4:459-2306(-)
MHANWQAHLEEAIAMLPKLKNGLDVNVRFNGCDQFEYTAECVVFDLLNIELLHGWCVEEGDTASEEAIGDKSYNQIVESIIKSREVEQWIVENEKRKNTVTGGKRLDISPQDTAHSTSALIPASSYQPEQDTTPVMTTTTPTTTTGTTTQQLSAEAESETKQTEQKEQQQVQQTQQPEQQQQQIKSLEPEDPFADDPFADLDSDSDNETGNPLADPLADPMDPQGNVFQPTSASTIGSNGSIGPVLTQQPAVEEDPWAEFRDDVTPTPNSPEQPNNTVEHQQQQEIITEQNTPDDHKDVTSQNIVQHTTITNINTVVEPPPQSSFDLDFKLENGNEADSAANVFDDMEEDEWDLEKIPVMGETSMGLPTRKNKKLWKKNDICRVNVTDSEKEIQDKEMEQKEREKGLEVDLLEFRDDTSSSSNKNTNDSQEQQSELDKEMAKLSDDQRAHIVSQGQQLQLFLDSTSNQLTFRGLYDLHQIMQPNQLAVFFRNNHFSTICKFKGGLYLLVTDLGYCNERNVVWEKFDQVDGDVSTPRHRHRHKHIDKFRLLFHSHHFPLNTDQFLLLSVPILQIKLPTLHTDDAGIESIGNQSGATCKTGLHHTHHGRCRTRRSCQ